MGYNTVTFEDVGKSDVPKINQAVRVDGEQYTSTLACYLVNNPFPETWLKKNYDEFA